MTEPTFSPGCISVSPAMLSHFNPLAVGRLGLTLTTGDYRENAPKVHRQRTQFALFGISVFNEFRTHPSRRAPLTRSAPELVALPLFECRSSVTCFAPRGLRMRIHNASVPRRLEACPHKGSKQLEVR